MVDPYLCGHIGHARSPRSPSHLWHCLHTFVPGCDFVQALIYSDMGSLPEAYEKAQAALSMRQKVLSSDHPDLAHSLTGEPYMLPASVQTDSNNLCFKVLQRIQHYVHLDNPQLVL